MDADTPRNIGLDLVRVTETAALAAGRWVGSGDYDAATRTATRAMRAALDTLEMNGRIIVGEDNRIDNPNISLGSGQKVGTGNGPEVDVVVDPIDGTRLLIRGQPGAVSIVGISPKGSIRPIGGALYMNKLVVSRDAANAIVPECLTAPAAWTLALVARVKQKAVHDMSIIVLDRPRNYDLIDEIRHAGARVILRQEGDAEAALIAAAPNTGVDMLMGIGGAVQGILSACAVKASGGAFLAQLAPQSREEEQAIRDAGFAIDHIMTCDDMVAGEHIFLAVTGITNTQLLRAMQYHGDHASTHSLLLRGETGTRRFIEAEHYARR
jgi:fructose-1,6-bisphosphatase II